MVEWHFLRFDADYRALPPAERVVYVHLWVACVHLRRDRFSRTEVQGGWLADMCGITPESLLNLIGIASKRLVHRHQGGSITVVGVRAKHNKLRGWIDPPLSADCGPDRDRTGQGPDQPPNPPGGGDKPASLAEEYRQLLGQIVAGEITHGIKGGYPREAVARNGAIILKANLARCINDADITLGRRDVADYEWEARDAK